jgi:hypothetical protein
MKFIPNYHNTTLIILTALIFANYTIANIKTYCKSLSPPWDKGTGPSSHKYNPSVSTTILILLEGLAFYSILLNNLITLASGAYLISNNKKETNFPVGLLPLPNPLFHSNALRQVPWLINVAAFFYCHVVSH